jgi:hypothetical protein
MRTRRRFCRIEQAAADTTDHYARIGVAVHLREDGGRWPHSRRAFNRQHPCQSPSLRERLKKGSLKNRSGAHGAEKRANSCFGRRSRQTGRFRADARKRRRRCHGHSASRRRRKTKASAGGQGLRRLVAKAREDQAAIPSGLSAHATPALPRHLQRRNVIERMFRKLKDWRRVETQYDRLAQNYLSGLAHAAIIIASIWLSLKRAKWC